VTPGKRRQLLNSLVKQGPRLGRGNAEATGGLLRSPLAEEGLHKDLPVRRRKAANDRLDRRPVSVTVGAGGNMCGGHEKDSGLRSHQIPVRSCVTDSEC
jgi:hypothetical protein